MGYGVVAYRDLLFYMIEAFIICTILSLPAILIFKNGDGY